jgi:hypothetical protein
MRLMKQAGSIVLKVAVALAFLTFDASEAQTNCPTPDTKASPPTALVASPLITVRFRTEMKDSVLAVPNQVDVYVKSTLKPEKVELWTGPTGTAVAESYYCISSRDHSVLAGQSKKFTFTITDCRQVSMVLEPRVYLANRTTPYSVYVGPFECKEQ